MIFGIIALKPVLPLFVLQTAWTVTLTFLIPAFNTISQKLPIIFTPFGVLNDTLGKPSSVSATGIVGVKVMVWFSGSQMRRISAVGLT